MPTKTTGKKTTSSRTKNTASASSASKKIRRTPEKAAKPNTGRPLSQVRSSLAAGGKAVRVAKKTLGGQFGKAEGEVKLVSKPTAQKIVQELCRTYPDAQCELTFDNDFQLLVAVILSAQCTDVTVNKVTPALFARFPTPGALASGDPNEVRQLIKPTGFFNAKAANIQACALTIAEKHGGQVPNTLEELVKLPGVGRKTANVVLGVAHDVPGWSVDTHVQRLSKRLGLSANEDPEKIEMDLQRLFPGQDWSKLSITIIWHGRRCCFARNPDCTGCPVNNLCPSSQV